MKRTGGDTNGGREIRDRLAQIERGIASVLEPDQRVIDEVYRRRARQLAERQTADANAATLAVMIFRVGTERYGIELSELAEVRSYRGCTAVPGAPAALLGVVNVRGDIKCVVDLRRLLDLSPIDDRQSGFLAMLAQRNAAIGLRIDEIEEVRQVDPAELLSAADSRTSISSRFAKALTADAVVLLDTNAALSGLGVAATRSGLQEVGNG